MEQLANRKQRRVRTHARRDWVSCLIDDDNRDAHCRKAINNPSNGNMVCRAGWPMNGVTRAINEKTRDPDIFHVFHSAYYHTMNVFTMAYKTQT